MSKHKTGVDPDCVEFARNLHAALGDGAMSAYLRQGRVIAARRSAK